MMIHILKKAKENKTETKGEYILMYTCGVIFFFITATDIASFLILLLHKLFLLYYL
jgi:hypothetical protein